MQPFFCFPLESSAATNGDKAKLKPKANTNTAKNNELPKDAAAKDVFPKISSFTLSYFPPKPPTIILSTMLTEICPI